MLRKGFQQNYHCQCPIHLGRDKKLRGNASQRRKIRRVKKRGKCTRNKYVTST